MSNASPPGTKERILERRAFAWRFRASGMTVDQVRDEWNLKMRKEYRDSEQVGSSTIGEDLRAKANELIEETALNVKQWREVELTRLDMMLAVLTPQVKSGHLGAMDRYIRLSERRSKLLGLDAPVKISATDPTGEKAINLLSDEEREARILELLNKAMERQERAAVEEDDEA